MVGGSDSAYLAYVFKLHSVVAQTHLSGLGRQTGEPGRP